MTQNHKLQDDCSSKARNHYFSETGMASLKIKRNNFQNSQ